MGCFYFLPQNGPRAKIWGTNNESHIMTFSYFMFHHKKVVSDLDLFSLTFDMDMNMSRNQNWSLLMQFQTFWIFNMFICSNSIPTLVLATVIMGLNMKMWTCFRSKVFETLQMGKVVQHCENIFIPSPV